MKRRDSGPYLDASANVNANPYEASQMQHQQIAIAAAQRMHNNPALNNFPGRPDSFPPVLEEERPYEATKGVEGQWQWDRDAQQMSPVLYSDGQRGNPSRSFYQNQMIDPKSGASQDPRVHQEQDMDIGYEDNTPPPSLEAFEQKLSDDFMKLTKEQADAEDKESTRHKEIIIEINNKYQEKLSALRAQYAARRDEILRREAQGRLQQYQLAGVNSYQNIAADTIHREYGGAGGHVPVEAQHRLYAGGQFDSHRQQRPESFARGRIQGAEGRVPTPAGRAYNTGPRYY